MRYRKKNKLVNIIIIFLVILIILWLVLDEYASLLIPEKNSEYIVEELSIKDTQEKIVKEYPKEEIIKKYRGYDVIAKLVIPKIELETYILKNFSESALNVSVTKFWGAEPNTIRQYVCCRT